MPELADRLPEPPEAAADPEVRRGLLPRAVRSLLAAHGPRGAGRGGRPLGRPGDPGPAAPTAGGSAAPATTGPHRAPGSGLPALGIRVQPRARRGGRGATVDARGDGRVRPAPTGGAGDGAGVRGAVQRQRTAVGRGRPCCSRARKAAPERSGRRTAEERRTAEGAVAGSPPGAVAARAIWRSAADRSPTTRKRVVEAAAVLNLPVTVDTLAEWPTWNPGGRACRRPGGTAVGAPRRRTAPGVPAPLDRQGRAGRHAGAEPGVAESAGRTGAAAPAAETAARGAGPAVPGRRAGRRRACAALSRPRPGRAEGDYTAATTLYTQAVTEEPRAGAVSAPPPSWPARRTGRGR
ncbi:hypothetical protein LV779_08385 [Streptomyces thinghirensis]|nr:hypothetical protein [Streptomyces thinghirensis]